MKKVLVLGVGAQGSAAAKKLDQEAIVEEVVCADYDPKAVEQLVSGLKKGRGCIVDAHDKDSIVAAAQGVDLIVNGLPLECTKNVLDAALEVKADYQDYAGTVSLAQVWLDSEVGKAAVAAGDLPDFEDPESTQWWESLRAMYDVYGPKFEEIGKMALFGTGSAPGTICVATRYAMRFLDTCDTIYNYVWEGAYAKRFQPFWWSPVTALNDMSQMAIAYEDGKFINTPAFGRDLPKAFREMTDGPIVFREHCHDEPLHYGFNADTYFKGVKNAYFKYAGAGMDFSSQLYAAGMLSKEPVEFGGGKFSPFDYALSFIPPAPKYYDEIKSFVDEGMAIDAGCMVIEAFGKKDGKDVRVEVHVNAPGFVESFEKSGITAEMYLTGQGGYMFSKLFLNDKFAGESGVYSSDMLNDEQVDEYIAYCAELDITMDATVEEL